MLKRLTRCLVVLVALVAMGTTAYGQGVQTGVLTGTVVDADGLVLPGVTVTVTSPALQGARTSVTDANGVYAVRGLPPGTYTLVFELTGMRTVEASQRVDLGLTAQVDAKLPLATVTEQVTVTAELPTLVTTTTGGANYRQEEINKLATNRTLQGIAELAPGLSDNTPNASQVTISGAFAYDNQFLVDGVDVADNLFGNPNNLFIEDAIEEVQVLTSGISAEYGRFGGGVVNAVTKSGGNQFSGSLRVNPYKPTWTEETPFETTPRAGELVNTYEWTLGGPIMRDRVWFFHAGRRQNADTPAPFPVTGIPFDRNEENNRAEIKGTATVAANQTVYASYLRNKTAQTQASFGFSIDPSTVVTRTLPNDLIVGGWRGVINESLFATVQVSRREFGFRNTGGTDTSIVNSPFISRGALPGVQPTQHYNAPYFDSTDPEDRNNRQIAASLSYFLTTPSAGSHDFKFGYENFLTTQTGGNSQSATGYVFDADYLFQGGAIVLDSNQRPIPVFVPGQTLLEQWTPTRGAQLDATTNSFYVHDHWAANGRLTFDLGVRYERVRSEATGGVIGIDTDTWVPRLGATYDLTGDGSTTLQTTYGHYAGKYSEAQIGNNTPVGNPNFIQSVYRGPAGQGRDFAPGFNPANYEAFTADFPLANVFFADGLHSPVTREFTLSLGRQLGAKGAVKGASQWRKITGFIEDFIDDPTASGRTTIIQNGMDFGTFDNTVYDNSDDPVRDYQAMIFQGNYRMTSNWSANAHWTIQLKNDGNFEGELANQPGIPSTIGDYPEIFVKDRNFPEGHLNDFQRHKVRAWTTYLFDFSRIGAIDASLLYRFDSPLTFSFQSAGVDFSDIQLDRDPGYASLPADQTIFYGERGEGRFEESHLFDLAIGYQIPVFKSLRPWAKFEVYNMFNNQNLVGFNTTVTPAPNSPVDANGIPTEFVRGARFGQATAITNFPRSSQTPAGAALYARTFLVSFGVRF
jgi:hypothetical protein